MNHLMRPGGRPRIQPGLRFRPLSKPSISIRCKRSFEQTKIADGRRPYLAFGRTTWRPNYRRTIASAPSSSPISREMLIQPFFPGVEQADLGAIPLGNLDPTRDRHPLSFLNLLDEPSDRLSVRTFYEDRMVTGYPDRAAVARPHLEAALLRWMSNERNGRCGDE